MTSQITTPSHPLTDVFAENAHFTDIYTVFQKNWYTKAQAHIDNLVNSQRIFKILPLTHSAENLL